MLLVFNNETTNKISINFKFYNNSLFEGKKWQDAKDSRYSFNPPRGIDRRRESEGKGPRRLGQQYP